MHTSAKQLLPVANKPVLFYGTEAIRDAGITDVGIVVGNIAPAIQEAVGDGGSFGLSTTYIRQDTPRGLAHAVLIARDFLGEDDFVMYLGDNFIVGRDHRPGGRVPVRLARRADHADPCAGPAPVRVAELDASGEVIRLEEKLRQPKSDLALVGVYIFTPAVHKRWSSSSRNAA